MDSLAEKLKSIILKDVKSVSEVKPIDDFMDVSNLIALIAPAKLHDKYQNIYSFIWYESAEYNTALYSAQNRLSQMDEKVGKLCTLYKIHAIMIPSFIKFLKQQFHISIDLMMNMWELSDDFSASIRSIQKRYGISPNMIVESMEDNKFVRIIKLQDYINRMNIFYISKNDLDLIYPLNIDGTMKSMTVDGKLYVLIEDIISTYSNNFRSTYILTGNNIIGKLYRLLKEIL
jgi:hypothetical protein